MGRKKSTVREEENPGASQGETKSNRKVGVIEDDEYAIGVDLSEDQQNAGFKEQNHEDVTMATAGKKKGKQSSSKSVQVGDEEQDKLLLEDDEEVAFMGKKKSKSKKGGNNVFSSSHFNVLKEEENDKDVDEHKENADCDGEDRPVFPASAFDALPEGDGIVINETNQQPTDEDEIENNDTLVIAFSGKKKSSKSMKVSKSSIDMGEEEKSKLNKGDMFSSAYFNVLKEEEDDKHKDEQKENDNSDGKDRPVFSASAFDALGEGDGTVFNEPDQRPTDRDEIENNNAIVIAFSCKKKSSKSKKSSNSSYDMGIGDEEASVSSSSNVGDTKNVASAKTNKQGSDITESSKNKKKMKKSGRTAQEKDDLYKLLAELGEGPSLSKPSASLSEKQLAPYLEEAEVHHTLPEVVSIVSKDEEKEAEEISDSAAAKKKRKKEKEKERKAAAAAAAAAAVMVEEKEKQEETKTKFSDKRFSKHVREIQEALARRKEAEERKKREDEERSRKEEEERRRQEELERLAVEARRRKKEREKKKLLKKKQEGKPLTRKQKEGAHRLEAKRKQFISQGGVDNACGPTKQNQETAAEDTEADKVQEVEQEKFEEKVEDPQVVEENGVGEEEDEEEDEWDAKSWDDVTQKLSVKSAFDEEESEPVVKRETMYIASPVSVDVGAFAPESKTTVSNKKVIPPSHMKNQNLETKVEHPEFQVMDNNGEKNSAVKKEAQHVEAISNRSPNNLRSPICCIMGHVDTGKTKLLDCIRGTNVQLGEAGGITQQIGATYFPAENIRKRTKELKADAKLRVPGLLVIDTPGHESFTNLRSRGSGLCDIAVLVVDIMHGLEPQTIESLNLLKMRNTEFIVALNKVDRLYGWKTCPDAPIQKALKQQSNDVQNEFKMRLTQIVTQFKEQGMNTELYYKNREMGETFSIVPTSAISGEGIPDLLLLLVQWTSKTMVEKLMFSDEVQCTVLEVKVVEGLGTAIDVVLVNGVLHEGDQIVVCGMQGPILTTIRALLTPQPMKEIRVKGQYLQHKVLKAAQGVKIAAQGLEHAIAGTGLYLVGPDDSVEDFKEAAMQDMMAVMSKIDKSGEGVSVQASTLGSLEALLEFLKSPAVNIPVSGISIGPVHKKDVMRASVMLEKKKEYATILAFDVKVTSEARELAQETGVKIFNADIIYHLFDQFKHYIDNLKEEKKKEAAEAVFPCVLQIFPNCIFNKKDPIVLGVDVVEGIAKVGTPICIPSRDFIDIGRISSIEINHKQVDVAKKGSKIAIKIASTNAEEQQKMFGSHFDEEDELVSHLTRRSIDVLKANYREKLSIDEWRLVPKLKNLFGIQ